MYMLVGMYVQVRAKLAEVGSILLLCGPQELNSGPQTGVQLPLPGESSYRSSCRFQWLTVVSMANNS